eukprot:gene16760-18454_t
MLAISEDTSGRPFDFADFDYQDYSDGLILETFGAEIEYNTIDHDFYDMSSMDFPRCTSSGVPSCSSSPSSSERDYGFDRCEISSNYFDDFIESDSSIKLHSCQSKINKNRTPTKKRKTKGLVKKSKRDSRKKTNWSSDFNRVLTCLQCNWTDLNTEKQQETLELLIGTVSQRLGLREQLQLIRIISPNANVSPNDTEFFIDFELFDEEKFRSVCKFVKKHLKLLNDEEIICSSENGEYTKEKELKNSPSSCSGRKTQIEKKILAKTSKQIRKEKRSGLFKQEQVLCIKEDQSTILEDDDEELDVVG